MSSEQVSGLAGTDVADLCFAARALAQTHAMSEASHRYRSECMERERQRQHIGEPADWAGTALLVGYCLRRTEEQHAVATTNAAATSASATTAAAGAGSPAKPEPGASDSGVSGELSDALIARITEALRTGDAERISLLPAAVTLAALDRLIATELDKRQEHLREQLDDAAWSELEDYIAWWVVHGYALRASERSRHLSPLLSSMRASAAAMGDEEPQP